MNAPISMNQPLLPTSATLLDALEEWVSMIGPVLCELNPGLARSIIAVNNNLLTAIESEADRGMIARRIEAKDREAIMEAERARHRDCARSTGGPHRKTCAHCNDGPCPWYRQGLNPRWAAKDRERA